MRTTVIRTLVLVLVLASSVRNLQAQHDHGQHGGEAVHSMASMAPPSAPASYLFGWSSGTSRNPGSWAMPMWMGRAGSWDLMGMGQAFVVHTQQSGPRGRDKTFSTNWGMLAAVRSVGAGQLMLRSMMSLEPLTVTGKAYPLLFQTGETAEGVPIVDGQHPHDALMELSVSYARPIGEDTTGYLYYAPVGDAAFGPVAFPHRASAMELPQAPLGHHWQDSTHIANNVVTAGVERGRVRIEASGFRGREPDEDRWDIDFGAIDSWSARLTYQPAPNWLAQFSGGRIERPESHHADDIVRTTASAHYTRPTGDGVGWSTTLAWARNYNTVARRGTHALLAETVLPWGSKNFFIGRFEWSQRDELFEYDHELAEEVFENTGKRAFDVAAYTVGYTREIARTGSVTTAVGANVTAYQIASELDAFYDRRPVGANVFLRLRLVDR